MRVVAAVCGLWLFFSASQLAQTRTVAITVDDLPYTGAFNPAEAWVANRKLLTAFRAHQAPVTGFVIEKHVEGLAAKSSPSGTSILREWIRAGFDLGNHSYSHPDINALSMEQIEREIVLGESTIGPLMKKAGKKLAFFRFPMNHTGDTREKHDFAATILRQRGYQLATCTIENSDYLFNRAYARMLAGQDNGAAKRLREEYLAYTSQEIDYYGALNKQVLGYEPPEVMLLHDNRLNADVIEQVLRLFEEKKYRFVSLAAAQADAAYRTPESNATKFGPMWGYRWAREKNVKVDGSQEPEPAKWILEYGEGVVKQP